jgi:organic hydroperoxide reductase OsmC/OhrA
MPKTHSYELSMRWTGNLGPGTISYRGYDRDHEVVWGDKPTIAGSSDPAFRGDPKRWSPEELLVATLSQCHMLWYLHLAAVAGVVVTSYVDLPVGSMTEEDDGSGQFNKVTLRPIVTIANDEQRDLAEALHHDAHGKCFIARSVNFPVMHRVTIRSDAEVDKVTA